MACRKFSDSHPQGQFDLHRKSIRQQYFATDSDTSLFAPQKPDTAKEKTLDA
jgi:hypothetical protein